MDLQLTRSDSIHAKPSCDVTCEELFTLTRFRGARCVAGKNGLDRVVRHVNVMEVPDVADWVRPGELLFTTGYPFRDHPLNLLKLIPDLVQRGVAALAIKTKRYIEEIPSEAIDLADQLNFPIFEMPVGTVFSEMMRDVMEHLSHQEVEQLSLLQERLQRVTNGLLEGGGLEKLLFQLESLLGNPLIWIEDAERWRWRGVSNETESFLHAMASSNGEWLNGVRPHIRRGSVEWLNGTPLRMVWIGSRQVRVHAVSIEGANHRHAMLIAVEWNRAFQSVDLLTIERVKSVIALELMNHHVLSAVETKYRDPFLQDWLWGRIPSVNDLRFRAEACGCPIPEGSKYLVALVNEKERHERFSGYVEFPERIRKEGDPSALWMVQTDDFAVVILAVPESENCKREYVGKWLVRWLREGSAPTIRSVSIGQVVASPVDLQMSYQEALQISKLLPISRYNGEVVYYEKLGLYPLFLQLNDSPERARLLKQYIDPLIEADDQNNGQLLQTLHVFFMNCRNIRKASEQLYTHYNTIVYRLERVRKILGVDLEQGEHMLMLEVALKLYRLDQVNVG